MSEIKHVCDELHLRGDTPSVASLYRQIYLHITPNPTRAEEAGMVYLASNTLRDPVTIYDIMDASSVRSSTVRDSIEGLKICFNVSRESPNPDAFTQEYAYRADAQLSTDIMGGFENLPVPVPGEIWAPALAAGWLAHHGELTVSEVSKVTNLPFEAVAEGITTYD